MITFAISTVSLSDNVESPLTTDQWRTDKGQNSTGPVKFSYGWHRVGVFL